MLVKCDISRSFHRNREAPNCSKYKCDSNCIAVACEREARSSRDAGMLKLAAASGSTWSASLRTAISAEATAAHPKPSDNAATSGRCRLRGPLLLLPLLVLLLLLSATEPSPGLTVMGKGRTRCKPPPRPGVGNPRNSRSLHQAGRNREQSSWRAEGSRVCASGEPRSSPACRSLKAVRRVESRRRKLEVVSCFLCTL